LTYLNYQFPASVRRVATSMPRINFRSIALLLGLLLLLTGGLKTHAAFADKPVETYLHVGRWGLLVIAEFEFFLGGWLLTGVYPRLARRCALMTFFCFLAVSLLTAFNGERSCSCFGQLKVSPWIAAFIDSAALIALLLCRSPVDTSTNRSFSRRALLIVFALVLPALPAAFAVSGNAHSPLLIPSTDVVDLGVLHAGEWRNASLYLTNQGDLPVDIETTQSSCPCLSLECVPRVVPPLGTAEMIVTLDLGKEPSFIGKLRIRAQGKTRSGALAFSVQLTAKVQEPGFLPQFQGAALAR
jgi:hypothetical protein